MALSGTIELSSSKAWRGQIYWSATQSISGNYSDVYIVATMWKTDGYLTSSNSYTSGTITINGSSYSLIGYQEFEGETCIFEDTIRVYHDSDGNKSFSISLTCKGQSGTSLSGYTLSGSGTVTLNQIDKTPPSVTCSISNITSNSFMITAASNVTANRWDYSLDGGSTWTNFSTSEGTSASVTVSNLAVAVTYSVMTRARKKSNNVYGTSAAVSVRTLGASALISAYDFAADASPAAMVLNMKILDAAFYHGIVVQKGTSVLFTVHAGNFSAGTGDRSVTLTTDQRAALLSAMAFEQTCELTLTMTTYSDSGYSSAIGSASTVKCRATTSAGLSAPSFPGFSYADIEQSIVDITGNNQVLLRLHSFLRILCSPGTAKNGASVTGYSASIANVSKTSATTTLDVGAVDSDGDLILTVTCTDSRGYSATIQQQVKVLPYSDPQLSLFRLRRINEIGSLIQLSFSGFISSLTWDGSEEYNEVTSISYRYKKTSETVWSEMVSLMQDVSFSGTSFDFESLELLELEDTSYNFHLQIQDKLYNISSLDVEVVILQGTPLVTFRKRNDAYPYPRVGINNPVPKYPLDVGGEIAINGRVVLGFRKELSGEDFDSLEDGIYFYTGSGSYNAPASVPGFLEAQSDGTHIFQRYTAVGGSTVYVRTYDGQIWSDWGTHTAMELLLDRIYPVGSIYMSLKNTSPDTFLGGSWYRMEGASLPGVSDTVYVWQRTY